MQRSSIHRFSLTTRAGEETGYAIGGDREALFAYVVEGTFEVQHRLPGKGDGLAIWNTPEIDIEALTENAVILAITLT